MNEYIHRKLVRDCELSEAEIATMSEREQLEAILSYEGILGYTDSIVSWISKIWNIEL